jgi:hypothetical protein
LLACGQEAPSIPHLFHSHFTVSEKILFISLCSIFHTLLIFCLAWFVDKQVLKIQNVLIITALCIGILTALTVRTVSLSLSVFADKKCKHNGEKNCNDNHESQKIKAENRCEIDNKNKDNIKQSGGFSDLICSKETQNLKGVGEITGLPPTGEQPIVSVDPSCGPGDPGFNVVVTANGFKPDSTVNWKLVNSQSQIPLYGDFNTNTDGGFNDATYLDDLKSGNYKMYFGTDDNNDNKFDSGAPTTYVDIRIPCP